MNNNMAMCHLFMKVSAMFDQNLPHTMDKIVKKHISTKNVLKLHLEFKGQVQSKDQKTMAI